LEEKESYSEGIQFGTGALRDELDPPISKMGADGGCRLFFWQGAKASPFLVYRAAWTYCDNARTNAWGIGIRFWDRSVAFETNFKRRSHSKWEDSNGDAIELVLTVSLGHGRGKPAEVVPIVAAENAKKPCNNCSVIMLEITPEMLDSLPDEDEGEWSDW
jgi:hypothetical protein